MLRSPANRSKMGRRPPPNEQAAIDVDHPVDGKRARNGRRGAQEAPAKPGTVQSPRHLGHSRQRWPRFLQGMAAVEPSSSFWRWVVFKLWEVFPMENRQESKDARSEATME